MARVLDGMYIGGGWTTKSQTFPDYNPSDGSIWANIPDASVEDTRRAIDAAHGGTDGRRLFASVMESLAATA